MAAPDGGWGWVVVAGTFFVWFVTAGVERSFGVWYVEILELYEAGAALSSWAVGLHVASRQMLYVLGAFLYVHFPARALIVMGGIFLSLGLLCSAFATNIYIFYLSFGVVGGLGASLAEFGSQIAMSEYFERRRFLAFGLSMTGAGFGSFAMSTLLTYLLLSVAYFESVLLMAGIALNVVVGGIVCFPVYEPIDDDDESKPLLDGDEAMGGKPRKWRVRKLGGDRNFETDMLWNPILAVYCLGGFLCLLGSFAIPQLVVDYAVEQGESLQTGSLLLTITGVMEIVARIGLGFLLSLSAVKPFAIPIWNMSSVVFGVSALIIAFSSAFWQFLPGLLFNVVGHALARSFAIVMMSAVFEASAITSAYSIYSNVMGLGCLVGTVLAGHLKDVSGSYFNSYLMMAVVCLVASLFYWFNSFLIKRLRPRYRLLKAAN